MATYPSLSRLSLIRDFITHGFKTKKEIINYLDYNDHAISPKTLERDFEQLKNLGYDLIFQSKKGYHIYSDNNLEEEILNRVESALKFSSLLDKDDELSNYLLDNSTTMKGIDLLTVIIDAIKLKKELQFEYHKFFGIAMLDETNEIRTRNVIPLWLKEHEDRFYLIALPKNETEIRMYGLDRIKNLKVLEKHNLLEIEESIQRQINTFKNMIGVSRPILKNKLPQLIQLGVSDFLLEYWKSKPIHESQEITNQKIENYTIVNLILIPNIDLIKLIVSGLGDIKLIAPKELKLFIKREYKGLFSKILD